MGREGEGERDLPVGVSGNKLNAIKVRRSLVTI